jgi:HPr kinase/phosphorylase
MQVHGSCAARNGSGVLLLGPPGAGKSDLLLRLLDRGFALVADDWVQIDADGMASPPAALAGLLEVRGLGIVRLPYVAPVRLRLAVLLTGGPVPRMPELAETHAYGVPQISLDPTGASAAARVALALDCACGTVAQVVGAFA